jgi:hypothetical protein
LGALPPAVSVSTDDGDNGQASGARFRRPRARAQLLRASASEGPGSHMLSGGADGDADVDDDADAAAVGSPISGVLSGSRSRGGTGAGVGVGAGSPDDWLICPSARLVRVDDDPAPIPSLASYAAFKAALRSAFDAFVDASRAERDTDAAAPTRASALAAFIAAVRPPPSSGSGSGSGHGANGGNGTPRLPAAPHSQSPHSRSQSQMQALAAGAPARNASGVSSGGGGSGGSGGSGGETSLDDAVAAADATFSQERNARFASEVPLLILERALHSAAAATDAAAAAAAAARPGSDAVPAPSAAAAAGGPGAAAALVPVLSLALDALSALRDCGHVTRAQIVRGVALLQDRYEDVLLDAPRAPAAVAAALRFLVAEDIISDREALFLGERSAFLAALARRSLARPPQPAEDGPVAAAFDVAAAKQELALAVADALRAGSVPVASALLSDAVAALEDDTARALAESEAATPGSIAASETAMASAEAASAARARGSALVRARVGVVRDWLGGELAKQLVRARLELLAPAHQRFARRVLATIAGGGADVTSPPTATADAAGESHLTTLPAHGTILVSPAQAERAFAVLLRRCEDLELDTPRAAPELARVLAAAVRDEVVAPGFLGKLAVAPADPAGEVVAEARALVLGRGVDADDDEEEDEVDDGGRDNDE